MARVRPIKPATLRTLLCWLLFFNVSDGLLTTFFLTHKIAEEANPLMDWAFSNSVILFLLIKTVWVGFNLAILWMARRSVWVHVTWILFTIFTCLFIYEVVFFVWSLVEMHVCK